MKTATIIKQLEQKYPQKKIIENKNSQGITTEIICELSNCFDNPKQSVAIAVIDKSVIHYHQKITEVYKVVKGTLKVFKFCSRQKKYQEYLLKTGDTMTINPGEIHANIGKSTWIEVISTPAWQIEEFYNLNTLLKKYTSNTS